MRESKRVPCAGEWQRERKCLQADSALSVEPDAAGLIAGP